MNLQSDPPSPPRVEMSWQQLREEFRAEHARIFGAMAAAAGVADAKGLVDLPIDELERLYLATSGRPSVDRLKMRACLLGFVNG